MQLIGSAIKLVVQERKRQDEKWGANRNLDNTVWLTILSEEVGESAEAILKRMPSLQKEIIQVAAVALAWLECVLRATELRNEAEAGGAHKAIYHECGNCGVPRFEHDGIIEKCLNCGDEEIDLSQAEQVP